MWVVRIALDRPYTFVVLSLLVLILSPLVILRTPTDIFPNINIPVIAVVWNYNGLNAEEMEGRLTSSYERALTTLVSIPPTRRSRPPRNFCCGRRRLVPCRRKS
jgi:multidrug efflux pump subunit AcrB